MALKKCIGIISYLPEGKWSWRKRRIPFITNLFNQLNELWPDIDIIIIAQNWQDYQIPEIKNKVIKFDYPDKLGILQARKILREKFLELDYDYLIWMDDDCKIKCETDTAHLDFMAEIDKHPGGYCFQRSDNHWHHHDDMARGPMNLFAEARELVEKEPLVEVELEKNEGMEDDLYVELIWHKYPEKEFLPPKEIYHTNCFKLMYTLQYGHMDISPSTWFQNLADVNFYRFWHNTNLAIECYEAGEFDLNKIKENPKWR